MKHQTNIKVVRSGDRLEIIKFKKAITYGEPPACVSKSSSFREKNKEEKLFIRYASSRRSKQTFTRLVYSNTYQWRSIKGRFIKPTLLTLTFKDNIKKVKQANDEFTKFVKRLNYEITGRKMSFLKYITAIEFQKRGAVHYHVLFFNYSYLPKKILTAIWRQGHIKVERIKDRDMRKATNYLCKYMTKNLENKKLCGQKSYFGSRGLKKPIVTRNQERNNSLLEIYGDSLESAEEFRKTYQSEYCGEFDYSIYDLHKNKELRKGVLAFESLFSYNNEPNK